MGRRVVMRASVNRQVAVIGGGIAGLTVADEVARRGAAVLLIEKSGQLGGHAAQLGCKATDQCVHCGACMVEERLRRVVASDTIRALTRTQLSAIRLGKRFELSWQNGETSGGGMADALVVASGFSPYDPSAKNFGYGRFANVLTSLEAERMLRRQGRLTRPSDGLPPGKIGYIQCVGSRDRQIGHPWCSRICCGSALRTLNLIRHRHPETETVFFYIDTQTFGHEFQAFYERALRGMTMIRAIPGEILAAENGGLQLLYFDGGGQGQAMELDLVVLSVGLSPGADNAELARMLNWPLSPDGFLTPHSELKNSRPEGIFIAGTSQGPMGIAASVADAEKTAADLTAYLSANQRPA